MKKPVIVTTEDCPVFCPHEKAAWNSHPRVFLDLTHGDAHCPYCGTHYHLSDSTQINLDDKHFKHDCPTNN